MHSVADPVPWNGCSSIGVNHNPVMTMRDPLQAPHVARVPVALLLLLTAIVAPYRTATAQPLPDLVVSQVEIDSECRLQITVTNQGAGPLQASAYQAPGGASVAFFKDGVSFGGWGLETIDPQRVLANPGGTVTWLRPAPKLVGTAQIRVMADAHRNVVAESDETNNSLTRSFSCTPTLPDLRISQISFTSDCRAVIHLDNAGDADLPDNVFRNEGAYVQRYLDGELTGRIMLGPIDPNRALQPPGGSLQWTDGAQYRASSTMKYRLERLGQEWNTANDTLQVPVPTNCQVAVEQPPDLAVSDIALDGDCRLVVTLTNAGPGPMPLSAYDPLRSPSINFYRDGAGFGGWGLTTLDPQQALITPGSTVSWTRQVPIIEDSATIRVNLDAAQELTESNENNNDFTKTLYCGGEPPAVPQTQTAPTHPDLAVTAVSYTRDCHPSVRLENLGDGPLDAAAYQPGGVYLERIIDGRSAGRIPLQRVDPGKALSRPHRSRIWTDGTRMKASRTVRYRITGAKGEQVTANNSRQTAVPTRCRTGAAKPPPAPLRPIQPRPLPLERR